jgi:hypothetical protein
MKVGPFNLSIFREIVSAAVRSEYNWSTAPGPGCAVRGIYLGQMVETGICRANTDKVAS